MSLSEIDKIIMSIADLQAKGDTHFTDGLFPSYRKNKFLRYVRPDNNIFYSATIVFILNEFYRFLSPNSRALVDQITAKVTKNYSHFQNKDGLETYNFWQTKPSAHFPNGYLFKHFEHFRIPDDIDDTALIYLTKPYSIEQTRWLKDKLKLHANLHKKIIKNTFDHYKNLKVYSTWFGKNMPIEFDVCALCNLMCLLEKSQLPYNEYDIDTYQFLREVLLREEFIKFPFRISHNYASSAIIIYHYARLIGTYEPKLLEGGKEILIEKATQLLQRSENAMEQLILETALLKLSKSDKFLLQNSNKKSTFTPLRYFIAGLLSSYENSIIYYFSSSPITQMTWHCEAHELALRLENQLLKSIYSHRDMMLM